MFLDNYKIELADQNPYTYMGKYGYIKSEIRLSLEIICDTHEQVMHIIHNAKSGSENLVDNMVPMQKLMLTCSQCFKQTLIYNNYRIIQIGLGSDVIGSCAHCNNIFNGVINE